MPLQDNEDQLAAEARARAALIGAKVPGANGGTILRELRRQLGGAVRKPSWTP